MNAERHLRKAQLRKGKPMKRSRVVILAVAVLGFATLAHALGKEVEAEVQRRLRHLRRPRQAEEDHQRRQALLPQRRSEARTLNPGP